ncbi:GTP-binding protein yptV2 [Nymphon striatum]|nr:GTP-binding protein yptV2 [Nymphon striatum]
MILPPDFMQIFEIDNEMDTHTPMDTITPEMAQPYYDLFHDDTENEDFDGFESDEDRMVYSSSPEVQRSLVLVNMALSFKTSDVAPHSKAKQMMKMRATLTTYLIFYPTSRSPFILNCKTEGTLMITYPYMQDTWKVQLMLFPAAMISVQLSEEEDTQSEIDEASVDFQVKSLSIDGRTIALQLWDTAGQERSSGLHDTGSITGAMPTSVASYPYWSGSGLVTAGVGACNHILHCRYARFMCSRSVDEQHTSWLKSSSCLELWYCSHRYSSKVEQSVFFNPDTRNPVDLDMFWSSTLNNVRLQEYVFKWMLQNVESNKEIFFGGVYGGKCRKLLAGTETQIAELASNQEEADDRIMFHIDDGAVKHGVQLVLVDSPDTDVFVNLIFHFNKSWQLQKLYVKLGNRKTKKTVPVYLLVDQLDNGLVSCLPDIHALSDYDSTSKVGPKLSGLKTSMDLSLQEGFGVEELSPEITNNSEKFLVSGLKKTDCSTFDEYRWEQYHNSKQELDFNQLVCCSSTLREHIKRAYLQCKMWLQAPTPAVTKPDPLQYGYEATDVGIAPVILPVSYRSITKQYFRRADGVIVMYDITSETSFKNVRLWVQNILDVAPDEHIVLLMIGNKIDLCLEDENRVITLKEAERLADEYHALHYEVSAKTGASVQKAMEALAGLLQEKEDEEIQKVLKLNEPSKKKTCCKT